DRASTERLAAIEADLSSLKEKSSSLKARWEVEKAEAGKVKSLKEQIERVRLESEAAERSGNLEKAAELRYGKLLALQKEMDAQDQEAGTKSASTLLRQEVTDGDIAEVVAKWTGIPVTKMLEGEQEKLLKMEE